MDVLHGVVSPWSHFFGSILAAAVVLFFFKSYRERRKAISLRAQGFVSELNSLNLGSYYN